MPKNKQREAWNISYGNFFVPPTNEDLSRSKLRIEVPEFQRNYVWDKGKIQDFIISVRDNSSGYYIGSLVFVNGYGSSSNDSIVDGQQRLVTLSLICKVLLKKAEKKKLKDNIKKMIFDSDFIRINFNRGNLKKVYEDIIQDKIINTDIDSSQMIIKKAHNLIDKELKDLKTDEEIKLFFDKITKLEFVVITCPDEDSAYRLFEGLKSTGLSLAPVELVKNSLLGKIKKEGASIEKANQAWEEMEKAFENINNVWFGKFLRHHWFGVGGYVNNPSLFREIKKQKIDHLSGLDLLDYIEKLKLDSKNYISLREASINPSMFPNRTSQFSRTKIPNLIFHIKRLELDQVYSVLFALFEYGRRNVKYFKNDRITKHIEQLLFFSIIVKYSKISPSSYERIFAALCKDIRSLGYDDFKDYMESPKKDKDVDLGFFYKLQKLLDRDSFVKNFVEKYQNKDDQTNKTGLSRFLLSKMSKAPLDFSQFTLEHILPGSGNFSKWLNIDKLKYSDINSLIEKIGNLTLIEESLNIKAGDEKFLDKCNIYKESSFEKTKTIKREYIGFGKSNLQEVVEKRGGDIAILIFDTYGSLLQDNNKK